jgi:DNA-binding LytR/AlgR family response regulator
VTGPVTAIVAEDEAPQRRELLEILGRLWPELEIAAECADGLEALEALTTHRPDIAFLDIRMPGLSGLEVARQAGGATRIVFITAYGDFAVQAFELHAVDYLMKPVAIERVTETIARLRDLPPRPDVDLAALVDALADRLAPKQPIRWITASAGDSIRMIPIDDVLLFLAEDKYVRVATARETAHIRTPLKDLEQDLDPDIFWRVHRNAIVRVSAIRHARPDEDGKLHVWLEGVAEPVRVSDAYRHRFRSM